MEAVVVVAVVVVCMFLCVSEVNGIAQTSREVFDVAAVLLNV